MSIKTENITKIYGQQKALDKVSFEISSGQIVGFLGPNGAGKSTMMKILTGYIPQTSGKAWVCGLNVETHAYDIKKQIGYLPEHNPLYPDMYVKEYLHFVGEIHSVLKLKYKVAEIIEITGLTKEYKKKIGALSKGYKQRVGLAQALIHNPDVLILDEPTTGLDPNQIIDIRKLIKNIGKEKTVMLSTHLMQEVEAICDKVIIIHNGKIVANEETQKLKHNTNKNEIEIQFTKPIETQIVMHVLRKNDVLISDIDNKQFNIQTNDMKQLREDLFQLAVNQNNAIYSLNEKELTIEQIFQEKTKE